MLMCGRGVRFAVALLGLSVVACGDDDKKPSGDDEEVETDGGEQVRRPDGGGLDASRGMDAARGDARIDDVESDGAVTLEDGAVVPADDDDAAVDTLDAQVDAATTAPDAAPVKNDAAADAATDPVIDAQTPATPDAAADASSVPDAGDASYPDAGSCAINSPLYGCGRQVSATWYLFESGLAIDRVSHLAWSPPLPFTNINAFFNTCDALAIGGLTNFVVPQIGDVRTFAAGCDKTAWVNDSFAGKCSVMYGEVSQANSGSCSCEAAAGPSNGDFCVGGSPVCDTLWTSTSCGPTCGEIPQSWFYNVDTGVIALSKRDEGVALTAKARCVTYVNDMLLP